MKLRYATWQAVSTIAQTKTNKVSLKSQLQACLAAGQAHHWVHTKDYTVKGKTRTQWTSLYHAEKQIPELHEMLEAAHRREFDLLVLYDLNRFRDLMRQIFDALCDCGIQLYILSDPREPVAPQNYTEERMNEVGLTVGLRDIISRSEITTLRRHYRDKMPMRIKTKKLHAGLGLPPYGYHKPPGEFFNNDAVLVQIPEQIQILNQIKDWFLAGLSLTEIAKRLNAQHIPSPRGKKWWYSVISYLLANPYYAGIVQFGVTKRERDRRHGTTIRRKGENPVTAHGKHKPLWDIATHRRILKELERRGKAHPGLKTRQLSRLLHCQCGAVMWAQKTPAGEYWRCSTMQKKHAAIRNDNALKTVTELIIKTLTNLEELQLPSPQDERPALLAALKDLKTKHKRWMDLYEDGTLSKDSLTERITALNQRIQITEERIQQNEQKLTRAQTNRTELQTLSAAVGTLPRYYQKGPPAQVNADLHRILARAIVSKDKSITLEWR